MRKLQSARQRGRLREQGGGPHRSGSCALKSTEYTRAVPAGVRAGNKIIKTQMRRSGSVDALAPALRLNGRTLLHPTPSNKAGGRQQVPEVPTLQRLDLQRCAPPCPRCVRCQVQGKRAQDAELEGAPHGRRCSRAEPGKAWRAGLGRELVHQAPVVLIRSGAASGPRRQWRLGSGGYFGE